MALAVGAEDQEQVLDGEGWYVPADEGDGKKPLPESIQVEREPVIARIDLDMELDEDALSAHQGQFPYRRDVGGLLGGNQGCTEAQSQVHQEAPGFREIALVEQEVPR